MSYGARAQRVPARGEKNLVDIDVYKAGLMCRCARGVAGIHDQIFSFSDFTTKLGGFVSTFNGAYVAKRFFDTLKAGVNVELKVLPYVASDAVQATADLDDNHGTPDKVFTINAALKGTDDKSAFGNKIGYKISNTLNFEYKLASDSSASASTTFSMTSVEHLRAGHLYKVVDTGTPKTEWAFLTAVDTSAKTVTFAALANATAYEAATTTLYRGDWKLEIAVKNDQGTWEKKEEWADQPMVEADTDGMPYAVNDAVTGSNYVELAFDDTNASDPEFVLPVAVTDWTALASGVDGTGPTDANWLTLSDDIKDEDMMIFMAPESTTATHNENMSAFATTYEKFAYYGQSSNGATKATLRELGLSLRQPVRFGMIPMDKWMEMEDPINAGGFKQIPPVGHAAAHWFNSYSVYGIAKVAAGNVDPLNTTDRLLDSNGLVHDDSGGQGDRMIRNNSVNLARFRRGKGITINSARTLSTDKGYIFQNQIMGFILIGKSIKAFLQAIEQDQAGVNAQDTHRNVVFAYLKKKYDANVFYKGQHEDGTPTTMADVVTIVNDFSINTLQNIANGIEEMFTQVVFVPPIEEPILSLASAPVTSIRS